MPRRQSRGRGSLRCLRRKLRGRLGAVPTPMRVVKWHVPSIATWCPLPGPACTGAVWERCFPCTDALDDVVPGAHGLPVGGLVPPVYGGGEGPRGSAR